MTRDEKRFIRREIINSFIRNKRLSLSDIKRNVRTMERFTCGKELRVYND